MSTLTEVANKLIEETNCSTDQAIHALEQSQGDYQKALELLNFYNNKSNSEQGKEEYSASGKDILDIIKKLIKEGNIAKISIKKDGETILNIPVNAAAVGIVLIPFAAMLGSIVALATDCTIEVQRKGNVVVNVNDKLKQAGSKVEKAFKDIIEK